MGQEEHRLFLRQSSEDRLVSLFFEIKQYVNALALAAQLQAELKKLDDKNLLVEVQFFESKTSHALGNLPIARASLTSARATANGIYCPPKLQGGMRQKRGILKLLTPVSMKHLKVMTVSTTAKLLSL